MVLISGAGRLGACVRIFLGYGHRSLLSGREVHIVGCVLNLEMNLAMSHPATAGREDIGTSFPCYPLPPSLPKRIVRCRYIDNRRDSKPDQELACYGNCREQADPAPAVIERFHSIVQALWRLLTFDARLYLNDF